MSPVPPAALPIISTDSNSILPILPGLLSFSHTSHPNCQEILSTLPSKYPHHQTSLTPLVTCFCSGWSSLLCCNRLPTGIPALSSCHSTVYSQHEPGPMPPLLETPHQLPFHTECEPTSSHGLQGPIHRLALTTALTSLLSESATQAS